MFRKFISKHRKKIKWNMIIAVFTPLSYVVTIVFEVKSIWFKMLPFYPIVIILILDLGFFVYDLYEKYLVARNIIDHFRVAHYQGGIVNEKGDLFVNCKMTIKNTSSNVINFLPEEAVRFDYPTTSQIPTEIIQSPSERYRVKIRNSYDYVESVKGRNVYVYAWQFKIEPGLKAYDSLTYEWRIDKIPESEKNAFKDNGMLHLRIDNLYEKYTFETIVTQGYKIVLKDNYVLDFNNQRIDKETQRMNQPRLNQIGNILMIEQDRPRPRSFYIYEYRLEKV
jgi:hypothetical protein